MRNFIGVLMTIAAVAQGWHVTFEPHPANHHVQMDTICEDTRGGIVFQAVDEFPVAKGSTGFVVRRHKTDADALCEVNVFLFQQDENGDFNRVDVASVKE